MKLYACVDFKVTEHISHTFGERKNTNFFNIDLKVAERTSHFTNKSHRIGGFFFFWSHHKWFYLISGCVGVLCVTYTLNLLGDGGDDAL